MAKAIGNGELGGILRGEVCRIRTPAHINDDVLPTDHVLLLEDGIYPMAASLGVDYVRTALEQALRDICYDALGVFCAQQCYYAQITREAFRQSPFAIDRDLLPKYLATATVRLTPALHDLEIQPGDLTLDRPYKVVVAGMRILARDHGIDWGGTAPPF